ncbi:MAG: inverse autotransporter beta domain-containing protein [Chlamydiales bacterium]|nr:inverse autotransporter beta domain-containing protein [Chlamydiales bacterium]
MLRFVFFAAILPLSCFAISSKATENCLDGKQHYRATIRHIESGGIGYEDGYTTLEAFLSSDPSQWDVTPFFDGRGHVFDNGKWAANAGVGLRVLWGNRAYGINTYYDYRNTGRFHSNQIGAGLETLGEIFDFRINGYLPISKKISNPYDSTFGTFSGNQLLISQKYHSAMKGANAEFGFHFGGSKSFNFYAAAGPYYFIGKIDPVTWGGKARISGTFKDIVTLEISDSYDRTFHNKFQGQISLSFSFGPKSKVKKQGRTCKVANRLNNRMLQPVDRQEIIVIDKTRKNAVAINPATGLPYFFVFVDNTSSSNGTYESPYHSLLQAQNNSSPNNIIYVFPGDGTTKGMDSGITLKANQKFWGSGVSHSIQTTEGTISIPAQSSSSPTITNTNIDTDGNAIILATNNAISGFTITSSMNDAIFGTDPQSVEVSSCTFENTTTYPIEASFSGDASISITNNQFLNNVNGIFLSLNGTSTLACSDNTFTGQTSISSVPLEISANSNTLFAQIENNIFNDNATGSIRVSLNNVLEADISAANNTMTNNGTGSQASLGSSFVILPTGTTNNCSILLQDNTFSNNTSNSLYLHTSGAFTTLAITASTNVMSNNGGSALVLATPVDALTLLATDNIIKECNDNGIATISSGSTTTGVITISNNKITNNTSNGIVISQDFSSLDLTILNNEINGCQGTGILSFPPTGINSLTLNISDNTISNCQNIGAQNAASGISLDGYLNLAATVANNTFADNVSPSVALGFFSSGNPNVCLTLTGNSCNTNPSYFLTNPGSGVFHLSPCNVDSVNVGTIDTSGTINLVQSCSNPTSCPP